MGKIKSDMEKLVNEVRSSVAARHRGVSDLREGARELLSHDYRERLARARTLTHNAKSLSTKLEGQNKSRLAAAAAMKGTLGRVGERRKASVRKGCSEMHHHLRQLHLGRGEMAKELKESVLSEVGDIREAVGTLKSAVRTMMGSIAADVQEARRLWRGGPSQMPAHR
jgi:hypothetical protein